MLFLFRIPRILLLILLFESTYTSLSYGNHDVYFSKIGVEKGLSQPSVMNIYQDELGNMWFGTREGINIYNGSSISVLQPKEDSINSLSGNLIKNICGNGKGSVFIQTQNGIDQYDIRTQTLSAITNGPYDAIAYTLHGLLLTKHNKIYLYLKGKLSLFTEIEDKDITITNILPTSDGQLIIGSINSGLYAISPNKTIKRLLTDCSRIAFIYEDSKHNIWVATWQKGLYRINNKGTITNYHKRKDGKGLSSNFVRAVCEDNSGLIWIGTKNGLDKLYTKTEEFKHYDSEEHNIRKLSNESVWSLYRDRQGTIWIGTYFGGVNYFNPDNNSYILHDLQKGGLQNKPFPVISRMIEDENGKLFLCTEGNGLLYYDPSNKTYTEYKVLKQKNIKAAYYDRQQKRLWLGLHLGGLCILDTKTQHISFYSEIKPGLHESNIVRAIIPYNENQMLIATHNGLYLFDTKTEKFSVFSEELHKEVTFFTDIQIDVQNNLWIAGYGLYKYNFKNHRLQKYTHHKNDASSISNNNINKIYIDSKQKVWIATNGGGVNLYNPSSETFTHYNIDNSNLYNSYISNLVELPSGKLLLTTTQGFATLDTVTSKINNYGAGSGFPLNSFYNGGVAVTAQNEIYIAGMNGMVSFPENKLEKSSQPFNIRLSGLWVNNIPVKPNDSSGILKTALPFAETIKLNYRQSMLEIEFSSDNYIKSIRPDFRYRLLGLSDQWSFVQPEVSRFNFINLNPGRYTLELQAISPTDGTLLSQTGLRLHITPPFYKTWYAYIFYILFIAFIIGIYIRFVKSKIRLIASLEYQKKEKEHIEAANQSKLRFFTNITHEFRTPLTIISSQIDMIMQTEKNIPTTYKRFASIRRNTQVMQNLINELMEFRKAENGKLVIKVGEYDLVKFVYEVYLSFKEYAEYKQIHFSFHSDEEEIRLWFDPTQMQKVFYNLISNAFKYTPQGKSIEINIQLLADYVTVTVKDSGQGIPKNDIDRIFERFYQVENDLKTDEKMSPGTGIGLALTKHIADAHSAVINVSSKLHEGSLFEVIMKKGSAHFSEEQKKNSPDTDELCIQSVQAYEESLSNEQSLQNDSKETSPKNSMLIVEDNPELLNLLKNIFEPIYTVYTASNGEEGLHQTITKQPDIVLSDLMMPILSGSEMCLKIKNNFATSHIPVVLLTAQTAIEANIESLKLGADDYITKPFNVKILITRCNNLVDGRRMLQEKFSQSIEFKPSVIASNEIDHEFIERAYQVIEQHISNENFDINIFSHEMALGRTKLFNKIKGITGQTPNEFILNIKMKKATYLLHNRPEMNIADIAYMLGFSSPKYFSKCFKEQFKISPSEFRTNSINSPIS